MSLLEAALSIVAPHSCIGCGYEGALLCNVCLATEITTVPSRCYRCHKSTEQSRTCTSCVRSVSLRHVWVGTLYEGAASELVLGFKFERAKAAHKPLGAALINVLPILPPDTLIVGVPTATSRIRLRGYDHTRLLVKELAWRSGLQYASPITRIGQAHQFGSSRSQRLKQLENAFLITDPASVKGKKILLVDDVLTTGATLETAAKALKNAGAKQIDAVVFAQKM